MALSVQISSDAGGRLTSIEHYWDTWGGSSYSSEAILGNACGYELTGSNRGLKTSSTFYVQNSSNHALWTQEWSESYSYDADLDYLTGANYGDGQANATPSWSYDAAGNRNDSSVVDNLNRATTIGGVSRTLASSDVRGANVAIAASFILAGVGVIAMVIAIVQVQLMFLIAEGYGDAEMDSCPDTLTPNEAAGNNFGGSPHW